MSSDDPFTADSNRTVLKPAPGGRRPSSDVVSASVAVQPDSGPAIRPHATSSVHHSAVRQLPELRGSDINPLVNAATALINFAAQFRGALAQPDVNALREQVVQQLRTFEDRARASHYEPTVVLTARYLLCTFLDECVLSTPWGSNSNWADSTLLVTFHNEAWGGEKFFQVLHRLLEDPATNLHLLELSYLCMAFGFQGKYAVEDRGAVHLTEMQERTYRAIQQQHGEVEKDLSVHWQGVRDDRHALVRYVPLWVVAAFAGVLLLIVYSGFRYVLASSVEPVLTRVEQLTHSSSTTD